MNSVNINKLKELDFQGKEAYNTLRSNIMFSGKNIKVIGLTSCIPNEGKSSVTMHLAEALSDAGNKVILIDADLRKSVLIGRYRIDKPIKGLTHYLAGLNTESETIYHSSIDNLDMMFAGPVPPNPSELLGGAMFADLIQSLSQRYDYILIDTPPLGSIIDGAVVATLCDGMILVIEANNISYKFAQKVKEQLDKSGCRILGAVLNKVDMSKSGYSKYYGKSYTAYAESK
ncbi:MAG: polysaccharide biosynthesis protein [Clostridiales bacterium]|jgi:capsular exopolysaccharide synthesis family protein|nr:polysaccharide biosynthesis protein [Clostridiales bacterium]